MSKKLNTIAAIATILGTAIAVYLLVFPTPPQTTNVYKSKNENVEAEKYYSKAMALWDKNKGTYRNGKMAIELFNKALAIKPANPNYRINRGIAFFHDGQFSNALNDFRVLQTRFPTDGNSLHGMAWAEYKLKQINKNNFCYMMRVSQQMSKTYILKDYQAVCGKRYQCEKALDTWWKLHKKKNHSTEVSPDVALNDGFNLAHFIVNFGCFDIAHVAKIHGTTWVVRIKDKVEKDTAGIPCRIVTIRSSRPGYNTKTKDSRFCLSSQGVYVFRTN